MEAPSREALFMKFRRFIESVILIPVLRFYPQYVKVNKSEAASPPLPGLT
jgi:hypothetical protein